MGADDDNACAALVVSFSVEDDNVATVDETAVDKTGTINLSSRHIREMMGRFPELLLVNFTHKTNK